MVCRSFFFFIRFRSLWLVDFEVDGKIETLFQQRIDIYDSVADSDGVLN